MESDVHIASYFGGLGDSLQFSTLPELYSKAGRSVYVWDQAYFRNPEIKELVWGCNPYISGTKSGPWNAGDTPMRHRVLHPNCISNWEMLHGFEPTNTLPKIHYKANRLSGYDDVILVDTTSISTQYDPDNVASSIREISENRYTGKILLQVEFKKDVNPSGAPPGRGHDGVFNTYNAVDDRIEIESIFHYCDLMNSCAGFIGLHSGASHLSACIKQQNPNLDSTCLISREQYVNNRDRALFIFDNIEYNLL